jgi:protein Mpv17
MNGGSLKDVEARVEGHYINTLKMNLVVWPAAMLVNFKYIPLQYQVLYANLVGFIWTIYLSWAIHKHKIVYDEII